MKGFGLVDDIIPEPAGGAHWDYDEAAQILKDRLIKEIQMLKQIPAEERISNRIEKSGKMGFWEDIAVAGSNQESNTFNEDQQRNIS